MVFARSLTGQTPLSCFDGPRSCFDGLRSCFDRTRSCFDRTRSCFNGPHSQFDGPRSQIDRPRSQFDEPRSCFHGPRSAFHLACYARQGVFNMLLWVCLPRTCTNKRLIIPTLSANTVYQEKVAWRITMLNRPRENPGLYTIITQPLSGKLTITTRLPFCLSCSLTLEAERDCHDLFPHVLLWRILVWPGTSSFPK